LQEKAEATLRLFQGLMRRSPLAAGQMLVALDFHLGPVREVAVVGDPEAEETRRGPRAARGGLPPPQGVALKPAGGDTGKTEELLPLLADKPARGAVTTYVCQNFACQAPLVGAEAAEAALGG